MKLLTRDEFREQVFKRDDHSCVFCQKPAADAHHILERRLWPDGGYYLDNGASVCPQCHMECEKTLVTVEQVRLAANISKIVIPPHLYSDQIYDKWGNPVLPNGQRLRGELFFDESVQKVLKDVLHLFTPYSKYPRTYHLPWSPGFGKDDRVFESPEIRFAGQRVIVTEKMDGENTSMYSDYIHARSIDGRSHPSRDWVKQFHSKIAHDIPPGWKVCGENLFAVHSIKYTNLETYFMGFSIWNELGVCLSWDLTKEWFNLLGITPVPVLYDGPYINVPFKELEKRDYKQHEGYVIRLADSIPYANFRRSVAKWVRAGHVQTTNHWMHGSYEVNSCDNNG